MSEGFSNPIIGGGGSLVYPSIHSPGFQSGVQGWTIKKDGSAEFNNLVIRNGTVVSGQYFLYSGVPALGNLLFSISATAGTDSVNNAYLAGAVAYNHNVVNGNYYIATVLNATSNHQTGLEIYTATTQAGPWTLQGSIGSDNAGNMALAANNTISLVAAVTATSGTQANPSLITTDTWHTVPYASGWSGDNGGNLQYRLLEDGLVELQGPFDFTSTGSSQSISTNNVFTTALPAAYTPAFQQRVSLFLWDGTMPSLTRNANRSEHILINTDGKLYLEWISAGPSTGAGQTARFFAMGRYKLS